ncbi:Cytochrome c peroxidase, mitochondrial [Fulvia fulva]|uniref:Peroxidase n=1 Tax=Passalora fulva TaxID=5499 RepID=A0A9Q8UW83_PASFU|nr:Cytochrome c peroxidase, mitochondrial [Fulvia fulva]KAK4610689.1 Cytochrome c peroxidase, mitochondrial [Fulvia fulva]KAK4611404.1 Cytochrome c peroxidase, mitochondrial [Fulvia fulva]UJO24743.1 Cytochrome c peroxidase, mitochondrial [Fulvia fulva]WPV21841.1 Cytochrome c peroxidase, mitochondrial [Fulvia fulva]WPV37255.1 Cytochrome c peroxidase, mitochondrial [Fulvia fulva]
MASASRTLTRAIRSTPATQAFRTSATRQSIARSFQQQARRGYSSSGSHSTNHGTYIWSSAAASLTLGVASYYTLIEQRHALAEEPSKFTPTTKDYQEVYNAIAAKLIEEDDYDDGSYGPILLRLGWHASGTYDARTKTGGSNGATMRFAPEKDHGANAGLTVAQNFLEPIHEQFPWITYSDLWTLAAACAVQEMGGPDIPWRPGRSDRDVAFCTPDGRLPDGSKEQNHLRAIFGRMGFNDQEIVALSGAHALGRCHTDRSGFDGPWTFSPITLTNDYYKLLFEEKWQWKKWGGPKQYEDAGTKTLMMLPTDMAIIKDESMSKYAKQYAEDQEKFFQDFSDVVVKLFELGVPFKTDEGARIRFKRTE